jgi:DNA-binding FadR family transcriptional regulator
MSLSQRIADQIRAALFSDQIQPGDFLGTEASLARQFGVSRMVSRDALRALEAMGIVEIRQGARGGVRVASGNLARFADALAVQLKLAGVSETEALDAQMALEATSAELAASRADAADRMRLRRLVEESAAVVDEADRFSRLASSFHVAVAEVSRNRALVAQLTALHQVLEPALTRRTTRAVAERVVAAHRDLLERLEARDASGARQSMCCHLGLVRSRGGFSADRPASAKASGAAAPVGRARRRS